MNKEHDELKELEDNIAGHLASSWLPRDTGRKIILFIFLILAVKYFMQDDYLLTIIMLILSSLFSPRAIGELVHFIGRIVGMIGRFLKFFN